MLERHFAKFLYFTCAVTVTPLHLTAVFDGACALVYAAYLLRTRTA